jgi:hypothetical protein
MAKRPNYGGSYRKLGEKAQKGLELFTFGVFLVVPQTCASGIFSVSRSKSADQRGGGRECQQTLSARAREVPKKTATLLGGSG